MPSTIPAIEIMTGERVELLNLTMQPGTVAFMGEATFKDRRGMITQGEGCYRLTEPAKETEAIKFT